MSPEERKMLEETLKLARENNAFLRKIHRSVMWGHVVRVVYWLVIIGASIGAFYLIQPYLQSLQGTYENLQGTQSQFNDLFGF